MEVYKLLCVFAVLASLRETSRHTHRKAIVRVRAKMPSPSKAQSSCWRPLATCSLPPHRSNHELDFHKAIVALSSERNNQRRPIT